MFALHYLTGKLCQKIMVENFCTADVGPVLLFLTLDTTKNKTGKFGDFVGVIRFSVRTKAIVSVFGASDSHMYKNTTDSHKLLQNMLPQRASVIKPSLYIHFDNYVNLLNCVQVEIFECAHARIVCESEITDTHEPMYDSCTVCH